MQPDGCYSGLPGVDPWPEARDARRYTGPYPVVAHPPCTRWGRYWHGSPSAPHQFNLGEDAGCFAAALTAVRNHGGVLEHPRDSRAWPFFGLKTPPRSGGWVPADRFGGWTCYVEQCQYGHEAQKPSFLYAKGVDRPELRWGEFPDPKWVKIENIGGKDKVRRREATPPEFRDLLLAMARSAYCSDIA